MMYRYTITNKGIELIDTLTDKLAKAEPRSSSWYDTLNKLQVLEAYNSCGETRGFGGRAKPGLVTAFDSLLSRGYIERLEL